MSENIVLDEILTDEITEEEMEFPEKDISRRSRRRASALANKKLKSLAKSTSNKFVGPYIDEDTGLVKNNGRGRTASYYKRQASKKARSESCGNGASYKKTYDYQWVTT